MFPPMPVIKHGSEDLKRRYLPQIPTGEIVMSFGVTEPNAGTDTSRIQTFAERQGDRFIVNGRKVWNTNARQATHMLLLARTAPRDPAKPFRGLTLFFTPFDRSKITVREIEKLGRAAVDSNEIFIDGLEIPVEDVVGEVGQGFYHLLDSLNPERVLTAIEAVGIGRAALERATQYAKERVVFDRPIGQNQAIAHPLAMAWAKLETAELMCLKAAWLFDHGKPCGAESNTAKLMAAEAGFEACDVALQTHGGLRLREGVPRRAALARGPPLQDRARLPADGPQLPVRARPAAAEELLEARRGGDGAIMPCEMTGPGSIPRE